MTGQQDETTPRFFIAFAGVLLAIGTLMVYSSSITARPSDAEQIYLSRHLVLLLGACLAGVVVAGLPVSFWKRAAPFLFLGSLALLVLVLLPGFGKTVNGAQRWLKIGAFTFQPSETAKLTLPLMVCALRFRGDNSVCRPDRLSAVLLFGIIGLTVLLVALEPDLGTAVFIGLSACLALFLSGWPLRDFFLIGGVAVPGLLALVALKPYQLARLRGFAETWTQLDAAPYQVQQSLTTLGVGGLNGAGLGSGRQKLSFLPEANTDFIFAVIGEELGLVGTLGVVGLWIGLYLTGRALLLRLPAKSFEAVAAETLLAQLVIQAAVNVAVVTAMLPPKGIAHPLISYGGSSLVISLATLGAILSLTRRAEVSTDGAAPFQTRQCERNRGHHSTNTSVVSE